MRLAYPFTEAEFEAAHREWGCNCGPSALAFALQVPLEVVRPAIPGFDAKRYTSPGMMKAALATLGVTHENAMLARLPYLRFSDRSQMFIATAPAIVRVQWCGPWTKPGITPKWAYRATHWIACWNDGAVGDLVFDCNGGIRSFGSWQKEIVPLLIPERGNGEWWQTHVWRIRQGSGAARPGSQTNQDTLARASGSSGEAVKS